MSLSGWFSLLLVGGSCCSVYAATTTGSCPPGWSQFLQDCFFIAENLLPWRAAKTECELFPFQSGLPQPKDQPSRQKLVKFLLSKGVNGEFWLGACDAMSSGKFRWLSGRDKPGTAAGQLDLTGPMDVSLTQTNSGWRAVAVLIAGSFSQLVAKDPDSMGRVVCHRGLIPTTGTK